MAIPCDHYLQPASKTLHLIRSDTEIGSVLAWLTDARASAWLAVIDLQLIRSEQELLRSIAERFEFPKRYGKSFENLNWDAAVDLLADLSWITGNPSRGDVSAFLLFVLHPSLLLELDPLLFANFVQTIADGSKEIAQTGVPFNVIVGPVGYRVEALMTLLRASDQICCVT